MAQKKIAPIEREFQTRFPVNIIWDGVLMIPIVGTVDSDRSQAIMDAMLTKIVETGATTCIFDIMGVVAVDTAVANHLIKITKATRLMGCETIISGISPEVAQGMVNLGIELQDVLTATTVREALKRAR